MQSNKNGLEYLLGDGSIGKIWEQLKEQLLQTLQIFNCVLKKVCNQSNYDQEITFTAEPENDAFVAITKTLDFD